MFLPVIKSSMIKIYIEVRLTDFALKVVFNNKVTDWISAYDGRGKEPKNLPVKFPLLLAQGVEGIAVGLSTKILPHNFNELIDASIKVLKGLNQEFILIFKVEVLLILQIIMMVKEEVKF